MLKSMSSTSNRLLWLDAVKGLGIVLVILGHSSMINGIAGFCTAVLYSFHLALFMMSSGYLFRSVNELPKFSVFVKKDYFHYLCLLQHIIL